jgi:hypothetical protein
MLRYSYSREAHDRQATDSGDGIYNHEKPIALFCLDREKNAGIGVIKDFS